MTTQALKRRFDELLVQLGEVEKTRTPVVQAPCALTNSCYSAGK